MKLKQKPDGAAGLGRGRVVELSLMSGGGGGSWCKGETTYSPLPETMKRASSEGRPPG